MRKKKFWKQHCALGMAIVLASGSTVTPAMAGSTALQTGAESDEEITEEHSAEKAEPDSGKEDSDGSENGEKNTVEDASDSDTNPTDSEEKEDTEDSEGSEDVSDSKDSDSNSNSNKEETDSSKDQNHDQTDPGEADEKENKDQESDEEEDSDLEDDIHGDSDKDAGQDENDGESSGTDDTESDDAKKEDGETSNEGAQGELDSAADADLMIPAEEELLPAEFDALIGEEALSEVQMAADATIKITSKTDLEAALNAALLEEDEDTPDQWYYYYTKSDRNKNWVSIDGDSLKTVWIPWQYDSLRTYLDSSTNPTVKVGINRTKTEKRGTESTSVASSASVTFINSAAITVEGLADHGTETKTVPKSIKYESDISFSITPDTGYAPVVTYSVWDDEEGDYSEPVSLPEDIEAGVYSYTIDGAEVVNDIKIEVSYTKTLTRFVQVKVSGGKVSVNNNAESDDTAIDITPDTCDISLKPENGYAIESIQVNGTDISLEDGNFSNSVYTYTADADEITDDAEPLILEVAIKKAELISKGGMPEIQWQKDITELDSDFETLLKSAIIDEENSYPAPDETDGTVKVEYLARESSILGNSYKELDYTPSGISGAGMHKFGKSSIADEDGNPIEMIRISLTGSDRYPDTSVEQKVVLKDTREEASFLVPDNTEIAYTDDLAVFRQAVYDQIVWQSAGEKPSIDCFDFAVKGTLTDISLSTAQTLGMLAVDKTPELKITFTGNADYREYEISVSVSIVDPRPIGEFTVTTTPITYTTDTEKLKQELYARIVWTSGTKPSIDQFSMQVKTGELAGLELYTNLESASASSLSVGTRTFKLKFNGNEDFRGNEVVVDLEIVKAKASVSVKNKTIIYGEEIPADLVEVVPSDAGVLKVYAGVNSDLAASVCVQFPSYMVNIPIVGNVDLAQSLEKLLGESASIDEILEKLNSTEGQALLSVLKALGVDTDAFINAFQTISGYLPDSITSFKVVFGAPEKAGGYTVVAVVVDPNYETAMGIGSLIILPKTENVELRWNNEFSVLSYKDIPLDENGVLDEAKASELFGATLMDKESNTVLDSSKIRYLYVGKDGDQEFYRGSKPSAKPGIYTQTAYVLNGDNMNWPIVRTYVIRRTSALLQFKDGIMENAPAEDQDYGTAETLFATKHVTYNGEAQEFLAGLYLASTPETEIENAEIQYSYYDVNTETCLDELPVNAGIYRVTVRFCGNGIYSDTAPQTGYLIIDKAQPEITVEDQQIFTYDGEAHEIVIDSVENQDPQSKLSVAYYEEGTEIEIPLHAGTYQAVVSLAETANYTAVQVEVTVTILPAQADIEIHPVSYEFDGQAHPGLYVVQGVGEEIPDYEVSYSADGENFAEEEPFAAGSYALLIQITDMDYLNDRVVLQDAVVITEKEEPGNNDKPGNNEKPGEDEKPGNNEKPGEDNKPGEDEKPGDNGTTDDGEKPGNNTNSGNSGSSSSRSEHSSSSSSSAGTWRQDEKGRWFAWASGRYPKDSWTLIGGKWFHFDAEGYLTLGWFRSADGKWYYCDPNGAVIGQMYTGWLLDNSDGYWYYLDPYTGAMATGWKEISGKWYYFHLGSVNETGWIQDSMIGAWNYTKKDVMPQGALYVNTQTPDGYSVDENGVRR